MQKRVTFIVAEKSYLVRKGIVSIINRIEHASVIKELDSLEWIAHEITSLNPDFIVISTNLLSTGSGYRNFTLPFDPSLKGIAIISSSMPRKGLALKFREIIHVDDERDLILNKLRSVIEPALGSEQNCNGGELSEREKTIVSLVAKGFTNKEIADNLFLSLHTVTTHRKNISSKLGIKSISGITVYAILNNLVRLNEIDLSRE